MRNALEGGTGIIGGMTDPHEGKLRRGTASCREHKPEATGGYRMGSREVHLALDMTCHVVKLKRSPMSAGSKVAMQNMGFKSIQRLDWLGGTLIALSSRSRTSPSHPRYAGSRS